MRRPHTDTVAPNCAIASPSVWIKATSTPSCEVPLICPIAQTDGASDVFASANFTVMSADIDFE